MAGIGVQVGVTGLMIRSLEFNGILLGKVSKWFRNKRCNQNNHMKRPMMLLTSMISARRPEDNSDPTNFLNYKPWIKRTPLTTSVKLSGQEGPSLDV